VVLPPAAGRDGAEGRANWAGRVAARAARQAGAPEHLLGAFVDDLARAAVGAPLGEPAWLSYEVSGRAAADVGVPLRALVDLYLTAAHLCWPDLPAVRDAPDLERLRAVGGAVLGAVDEAVAALCQGYSQARRSALRAEEAQRREFVDDLLIGTSDLAQLVARAPSLGLRLEGLHVVLVVTASRRFSDGRVMVRDLEALLLARAAAHPDEPDLLVATKSGLLVVLLPAADSAAVDAALPLVTARLSQEATLGWRLAVSRARPGAGGVRLGFEEARAALEMTERLGVTDQVVRAEDLLVYQVLTRDREAMRELIRSALLPLEGARGGAVPLLETLRTYLATGAVAVHTAQRMHLSVRAVTYRLERIRQLTGRDPSDPDGRYVLETALRGALMLRWPQHPL
jgi:DNA-binding PucR family transcriptional regulator